ncbi:MAG TPA: Hsp20/alpha crystallin family protein [Bryobacteraceae bacterium]|nr:Hsp20/alpha crystallin family protein [Bryobacteraceae bacterium]
MSSRTKTWALLTEHPAPWQPSVDVYRTRYGWLLKFDLAGVRREDVSVTVCGRRVSVSGIRRDSLNEEGCSYYSMEISYNRFERTLEMPCDLGDAEVSLQVRDGLLLVRMITEGNQYV